MSTQVQFRRGTTTQNNAFTGAQGELSVDTDLKTIRLHDGTTAGGGSTMLNNISPQTALNKTFSTGSVWQGNAVGLGYGGTGSALTANAGAVLYSTSSGLALSSSGTSGQVLVSGGSGAPTFVAASSISAGTATLATTATNIAGGSAGQLIIQADTGLSTFITAGASGTFLRSAGAGYAPTWATADVTIGSTVISLGSSATSLAGLNILAATGTSHWTLPVGTTAQRPGTPAAGMVRYNSTQATFEGYSSGAWSSLGGVKSVDALTYIIAETSAGASNGELEFYAEDAAGTGTVKIGGWNRSRLLESTGTVLGTQTTQNLFNTVATTLNLGGAATTISLGAATGTLTVANTTLAAKAITASTTLAVTGATTLTGALAANGGITVDSTNFTVDGTTGAISTASTLSVGGNTTLTGDVAVNGGDVTTTALTATLFNTGATTLNIGGAATTISIGASTGTLTLNNANTVITGNLTVNGTTTTINSTVTSVDDIEFELGSVATPTDITAIGGGIRLKGATDKTINWSSLGWTSSEDFNLVTGKVYEINGTSVLSATTLGSGVTASSLTSVGTIGTGVWQGTVINSTYGGTGVNNGGRTITLNSGNLTIAAQVAGSSVTIPSSGTLVSSADTGTVTSTMIADGTIVNDDINAAAAIAVSKLAASTISGVTLGNNLNALTIGTGLSGTSYNGSSIVTVALDGTGTVGAGTYGSTADNSKIDSITVDAYGRITAVVTGTTGDIGGVTAGNGLTGGGTTGTVALAVGQGSYIIVNATDIAVDATSANTASKVVARDASGDFSAGSITATNLTATTAVYVGTIINGSATLTLPGSSGTIALAGYPTSTTALPTGDLGSGETFAGQIAATDAFSVGIIASYTLMEPIGSVTTLDLNA